ncbi:MAG TPA: 30S ribosomal protein S12 methylthiotransferase RimO [Bacillota bacterium]|nr:30S ribosomal protein S12 methylthiotransferase RimO [Bacillota bacterium]
MVSLGCARNRVDSEVMLGLLGQAGFEFTAFPREAEVIIVNTCAFIGPARAESAETIKELERWKDEGRCRVLLAAGCLPQREGAALTRQFPGVDGLLGTGQFGQVVEIIQAALDGAAPSPPGPPGYLFQEAPPRLVTTGVSAYVKLAEGCSRGCTFCAIPRLRGPMRSRRPETVVAEARTLVELGASELVLVGQDTTAYGLDLQPAASLAELLEELAGANPDGWVRVLYGHPDGITRPLLAALAGGPPLCRYLDVPFQHVSPSVLQRMGRRGDSRDFLNRLAGWRRAVPGLTLRTTFITGFPGETEADFELLRAFVREAAIDHIGAFTYSREPGTPAADLPDQVPSAIAEERRQLLLGEQRVIARRLGAARVGKSERVLLERATRYGWRGRTERDAPEADGVVRVRGEADVALVGRFVTVSITGAGPYHLEARLR